MQDSEPPMKKKEIATNSDNKKDQDFPGFPYGKSTEKLITPKTDEEKKVAALHIKDGEKVNKKDDKKDMDESQSDGSGGAFNNTENTREDDYDNSRDGK